MSIVIKYPLPLILKGICTPEKYQKWLHCKADTLYKYDTKHNRKFGRKYTQSEYKKIIHEAVMANDGTDPYTGDKLRWDLISRLEFDKLKAHRKTGTMVLGAVKKEYLLLPVVDHVDPESGILRFEICSWIVNESKNQLTRDEYIELCRKVLKHSNSD